jgi:YegS/Rv2252/BmrU family lipid kinase
MSRAFVLIVNPAAGGGRAARLLPAVRAAAREHALEHRVELTASLEHACELAREAAARGQTPVAVGGDGLAGALAGALAESDAVLGLLPAGRGNDLARALGIPRDPRGACAVLAAGSERKLDLGVAGARNFFGVASCGLDSEVNRIANETRLPVGNLVYAYGLLRALPAWRPARFRLELDDGERRELVGYSVAAANSGIFGGGMRIAPDASMEDGLLDVVLIAHVPRRRFLALAPSVFWGAHVRQPNVEVLRARTIELDADRPFALYADGEAIAQLPARLAVRPAAIRVLAPPAAATYGARASEQARAANAGAGRR